MLLALATLIAHPSWAADPVDLGVLKDSDLRVVQKMLYVKEDRLELGAHVGVMPFDGFTVAPIVAGSGTMHFSELVGAEVHVAGGYGFTNAHYNLLASDLYGVAVEAYRFLASVEADLQFTPIYAKMNLGNGMILHHDVYVLVGVGATLEQSVLPAGDIAVAPTIPLGIGARIFLSPDLALRAELRDNLMVETRKQSATTAFKQNAAVTVGLSFFGKAKP